MSDRLDLLFRAPRVITAAGEVARCVGVRDGRIVVIEPFGAQLDAEVVVELGDDEVLIPGLVDTHVHVNEPGRTEWEGFASATRAAAAGGVTTIVDMPLNSIPPTVDALALDVKRRVAADQAYVGYRWQLVECNRKHINYSAVRGRVCCSRSHWLWEGWLLWARLIGRPCRCDVRVRRCCGPHCGRRDRSTGSIGIGMLLARPGSLCRSTRIVSRSAMCSGGRRQRRAPQPSRLCR